jgi:hypothetical protein
MFLHLRCFPGNVPQIVSLIYLHCTPFHSTNTAHLNDTVSLLLLYTLTNTPWFHLELQCFIFYFAYYYCTNVYIKESVLAMDWILN